MIFFVVSEKEVQKLTSMEVTLFDEALFSQVRVSRTTVVLNVKSADVHSACGSVCSSITFPGEWPLLLVTPFKDELEVPSVNPLLCRLAESVQGKRSASDHCC